MRFPRSIHATVLSLLVAAGLAVAAPAKAESSNSLNDAQIRFLFSGAKVRGTKNCIVQFGYPGTLTSNFVFRDDGTFSVDFRCETDYVPELGADKGTWRVEGGDLCLSFDGSRLSTYIASPYDCWTVRRDNDRFSLHGGTLKIWNLSVSHPNHPTQEKLFAELDALADKRIVESVSAAVSLPPAEYKPLPVGTTVRYDNWSYTVMETEGFKTVLKETRTGIWNRPYGVFGRQGEDVYTLQGKLERSSGVGFWDTTFNIKSRSGLETLWPLAIGKKAALEFLETREAHGSFLTGGQRAWHLNFEVLRTEGLNLGGEVYPTYVVEAQAVSEKIELMWHEYSEQEYKETYWYNPESGLILKFEREWLRGGEPRESDRYVLLDVTYPKGTTTHALKGTRARDQGDQDLQAKGGRLDREAGVTLKAGTSALPPAPYKAPPVGTRIKYDDRIYRVTRSDGFLTVYRWITGDKPSYLNAYALFGEYADDLHVYAPSGGTATLDLDGENRKKLEALWPLKVGNKTRFSLDEGEAYFTPADRWTVTLEVSRTETIVLDGKKYDTYVIDEKGRSDSGKAYAGRKWYHPPTGLVVRAERTWKKSFLVRGNFYDKVPHFSEGEKDNYTLVRAQFPDGTTAVADRDASPVAPQTLALSSQAADEAARLEREAEEKRRAEAETSHSAEVEIARLRREAEEARRKAAAIRAREAELAKAREAEEARKAEAEQARAAEIARLEREAEEARREAAAVRAREAESAKARETTKKRKAEAEKARAAEEKRRAEAGKARAAEIARLERETEEARREAAALRAREAELAKARAAEVTRLQREAEEKRKAEAEKARAAEVARLEREAREKRQAEAEAAAKAAKIEIARLRREAEESRRLAAELRAREAERAKTRDTELARLRQEIETLRQARKAPEPATAVAVKGVEFGRYHALVVGINSYKSLPKLKTAINDARVVARVLQDEYGFNVTLLIDADRLDIIDALDVYRETLGPKDNLLIYYAGHGWLDQEVDRGYWLPVDAQPKRRGRWVSNATITDTLKALSAKHVMVVADSCYSGTLVRGANVETRTRTGDYWKQMAEKWTRVAITSGGLEPVADKGGGGHSPFAKAFVDALRDNDGIIDGTQLFTRMRRPVMVAAKQTPQYADVREAGHDGGDFLFVRRK